MIKTNKTGKICGVIIADSEMVKGSQIRVLGVIKTKLWFRVASTATRIRDLKSRITEVNSGGRKAN
jgi:hypothetical protein